MSYWLVKSEPDECGIDDFVASGDKPIRWDGIRNYQARNFLRAMKPGDQVLLYHSSCKQIGVAGVLEVVTEPYVDPLQFEPGSAYYDAKASTDKPKWSAVDMRLVGKAGQILPLATLKKIPALQTCALLTRPRLSVMSLTEDEWQAIIKPLGHLHLFSGANG